MKVDNVEVHILDLRLSASQLARARDVLSVDERYRVARLKLADEKERLIARRAGLRVLLGGVLNVAPAAVRISYSGFGKPRVQGTDAPEFSVSYSSHIAAIALSATARTVGLDIEPMRENINWRSLLARLCDPDEQREAIDDAAIRGPRAFFERWVAKEAVLKAEGCGLTRSPRQVRLFRGSCGVLRNSSLDFRLSAFDLGFALPAALATGNYRA